MITMLPFILLQVHPFMKEPNTEIDCHFVRDHITAGSIKLLPIRSHHQLVDMFAKPLPANVLFPSLSKMAINDSYCPS